MNYARTLEAAFARREPLYGDPATDCFRLLHGAADGLPGLAIDRYGPFLLVLVEHPELLPELPSIAAALAKASRALPEPPRGILWKDITGPDSGRIDDLYAASLVSGELPPPELIVRQNGISVGVELLSGRHTGLFLDMRLIRARLAPYYAGRSAMLNLFCYTGVFSVHALKSGLASALNIDLAKTALDRVRRNYLLNGLPCDERDFMYGDALGWMKAFAKKGRRFDVIVLDPPTFARAKKGLFSAQRDFPRCLALAGELAAGGLALTVINSPAIARAEYQGWHPRGWKLLFLAHEPDDFPRLRAPYLKAGLWQVPA